MGCNRALGFLQQLHGRAPPTGILAGVCCTSRCTRLVGPGLLDRVRRLHSNVWGLVRSFRKNSRFADSFAICLNHDPAADGIDHLVEVAFGANIEANIELLKQGGSIARYASPKIPFWQMVFKNIRAFFLGSDDFPKEAKMQAARDLKSSGRL
jgi:hypothetical protein